MECKSAVVKPTSMVILPRLSTQKETQNKHNNSFNQSYNLAFSTSGALSSAGSLEDREMQVKQINVYTSHNQTNPTTYHSILLMATNNAKIVNILEVNDKGNLVCLVLFVVKSNILEKCWFWERTVSTMSSQCHQNGSSVLLNMSKKIELSWKIYCRCYIGCFIIYASL